MIIIFMSDLSSYEWVEGRWERILTTAAISAPVLWLIKASTREDKKKKKALTAVLTRSCRRERNHRQIQI